MAALLAPAHYQVEQAASAEEALRVLHAMDCHIVLTDWQMPGMDGLTLCRTVRFTQTQGYIYMLMLTVRKSKGDLLRASPQASMTFSSRAPPAWKSWRALKWAAVSYRWNGLCGRFLRMAGASSIHCPAR